MVLGFFNQKGLIYRVGEFCKLALLERERGIDIYKILLKDVMMDVNSKVTLVYIALLLFVKKKSVVKWW